MNAPSTLYYATYDFSVVLVVIVFLILDYMTLSRFKWNLHSVKAALKLTLLLKNTVEEEMKDVQHNTVVIVENVLKNPLYTKKGVFLSITPSIVAGIIATLYFMFSNYPHTIAVLVLAPALILLVTILVREIRNTLQLLKNVRHLAETAR